jgi:ABC-type sugar transport system ATPase subunit
MTTVNGSSLVHAEGVVIEGRDLVLSFGETPALRGASLSVKRGEIVAVMGPSGSGKSTLLYCLAGILGPDSGEVYFESRRIDALREQERSTLRRDHFGFVFQFGQLVPELTAEENVALPLLLAERRQVNQGILPMTCPRAVSTSSEELGTMGNLHRSNWYTKFQAICGKVRHIHSVSLVGGPPGSRSRHLGIKRPLIPSFSIH